MCCDQSLLHPPGCTLLWTYHVPKIGAHGILEAIDNKAELHRRKRTMLEELFKALPHKLMTGEIRVGSLDLSD